MELENAMWLSVDIAFRSNYGFHRRVNIRAEYNLFRWFVLAISVDI